MSAIDPKAPGQGHQAKFPEVYVSVCMSEGPSVSMRVCVCVYECMSLSPCMCVHLCVCVYDSICASVFVSMISRVSHSQQEGVPAAPAGFRGEGGWLAALGLGAGVAQKAAQRS